MPTMRPISLCNVLEYLGGTLGGTDAAAQQDALWCHMREILSCGLVSFSSLFYDASRLRVSLVHETEVSFYFAVRHTSVRKTYFFFDLIKGTDTLRHRPAAGGDAGGRPVPIRRRR